MIALARRARRLVIANLATAFAFISVQAARDLFGDLPLPPTERSRVPRT